MGSRRGIRHGVSIAGLGLAICLIAADDDRARAAWLSPVAASEVGGTVSEPQVAVDAAGNATAVWVSGSAPSRGIRSAFRPAGGGWEASASRIGLTTSYDCHDPRLVVNPAGAALLVAQCEKAATAIKAAYRPSTSWNSGLEIPGSAGGQAPRAAIDDSGNAVVVWAGPGSTVQASYRAPAGSFSTAAQISTVGKVAFEPNVGMSGEYSTIGAGFPHAIWREKREETVGDPVVNVMESRRELGSSGWTSPNRLTNNFGPGSTSPITKGEPQIDVSPNGHRMMAWTLQGAPGSKDSMQTRTSSSDFGSFSNLFSVIETGSDVEVPRIAVDDGGLGAAVWFTENLGVGGGFLIRAATTSSANGPWSSAVTLAGPSGISVSTKPMIAADPAGDATAIWIAAGDVTVASRPSGGAFAPATPISNATHPGFGQPRVEMSAAGDALAVWPANADHVAFAVDDATPPSIASVVVPATVEAGASATMSALASDTWSPATLAWGFSDGSFATGASVDHTWGTAGTKTVTIEATDGAGNSATTTRTISVIPSTDGPRGGDTPPPVARPPVRVGLHVELVKQTWKAIKRAGGIKLRCQLDADGSCAAKATVTAAVARRIELPVPKKAKAVDIGSGSVKAGANRLTVLKLKLTSKARAAIDNATRNVPLTLAITASATGHVSASVSKSLVVRRR